MRRADRLFDIIQILRSASKPVTASQIADELEVTTRTIYRDIASLQASRVPIDGEAGIGYIMRAGYDLSPLMFNEEEMEALIVGLAMLRRTTDRGLHEAAKRILDKISTLTSKSKSSLTSPEIFYVSSYGPEDSGSTSLPDIRKAIRKRLKLRIHYKDEKDVMTSRVIHPLGIAYFIEVEMIGGWCELREDFRNFRLDRIQELEVLDESFTAQYSDFYINWLRDN